MTEAKKRILFVDDEPAILAGLQNALFRERKKWDLVFATSGEDALAMIRKHPFDVVVSDMRMPGMDGAELLTTVMHECPGTARIVLSGQAEREAILRALPALHQLLSKPCDGDTLRAAIERGLRIHTLPPAVTGMLARLDKLPSPAKTYHELAAAIAGGRSATDLVAIVERDPGMSAKILQLVNSAYFGAGRQVASITRAIALLGTEPLKYLTLTTSVFSSIERDPFPGFSLAAVQQAALDTAQRVRTFLPGADLAFAAALLHDIGRTALAIAIPERYCEIVARGGDLRTAERELLGVAHPEVGACVLELWGLPRDLYDLVRWHHEPWAAPAHLREHAAAIYIADRVADGSSEPLDEAALAAAGLTERVAPWLCQ